MSLSGESLEIGSGLLMIYCVAAVIRMCNWTQNDTYRSAGDAAYGTILEISFMYALVLPCVCLTGLVWKAPFLLIFACCYIDEPIRFILMQVHMYSGKWVRPVTELGRARCLRSAKSTCAVSRDWPPECGAEGEGSAFGRRPPFRAFGRKILGLTSSKLEPI